MYLRRMSPKKWAWMECRQDWTSIVLPSIAVFVLLVSFAIYMTPNKAEARAPGVQLTYRNMS